MPRHNGHDDNGKEPPDSYTRLNIRINEADNGIRPLPEELVTEDTVGYRSPDISFSQYPIPAGEPTLVRVVVWNRGTMDSTSTLLEVAYNLWIGNEAEANEPIGNATVPNIPSGGSQTVEVEWTPPDTESTHACVHARVFDIYSLSNYPDRSMSWNSWINPQAGNRNVRLVPIEDERQPLAVLYRAKNFRTAPIRARGLVTEFIRERAAGNTPDHWDEKFPLPFDRTTDEPRGLAARRRVRTRAVDRTGGPGVVRRPWRDPFGRRVPRIAANGLWPREDVHERLKHGRFGFDLENRLELPAAARSLRTGHVTLRSPLREIELKTLQAFQLEPDEEQQLRVVIPPDQFPARGRRRVFRLHYQVGHERPVVHTIILAH